ncbi:MAG: PilC/PilY family type IV pilus protein [Betaproteobacteria bacterium]|nr:PilC/PilY family type IV pilus protein [Betaproteobacteria bacterium]
MNRFFRRMSLPQKTILGLAVALFPGLALPQATPDFEIAQRPLTAGTLVAPNLVYIHDDSSSMLRVNMPDSAVSSYTSIPSGITLSTGTFTSSLTSYNMYSVAWNTVYYNPKVIYQPPIEWRNGQLRRMPNSDTLSAFPSVRRSGYPSRSSNVPINTMIMPNTAPSTAVENFATAGVGITSAPTVPFVADDNATPNLLGAAIYYDYVPGFHSMRDNPNYSAPNGRPEDNPENYEYWAFRAVTAGDHFRNHGDASYANRTAAANRSIVYSRACPAVFPDVEESRDYHGRAEAPGTGVDNPNGQCRLTYRSAGVTSTAGILSNIATAYANVSLHNSPNGRPWCIRTGGYNFRTDGSSTFGSTTAGTPLAWMPYPSSAAATSAATMPQHLTCNAGRHVIGDSTGKGYYDASVDTPDRLVAYFEYRGNNRQATRTTGTAQDMATANCRPETNEWGGVVCTNLYGPEQSRLHLVTHYVGDDGELVEIEGGPRPRTVGEEIRNFMNWYSYHRSRNMAAKVGMTEAFAFLVDRDDTTKPSAEMSSLVIRLGYDTINSPSMGHGRFVSTIGNDEVVGNTGQGFFLNFAPGATPVDLGPGRPATGSTTPRGGIGVLPFLDNPEGYPGGQDTRFVKRFYDWVLGLPAPSNTPLKSALVAAGEYYRTDRPWMDYPPMRTTDPGSGNANMSTCRRSFTILMTDGYDQLVPNSGCSAGQVGAHDCTPGPGIDGFQSYTPQTPFATTWRGLLGDWAMYYWKNDLKPGPDMLNDLARKSQPVPTYKKNEAWWQHMQTFTLGFGVQGTLSATELKSYLANPNVWNRSTGEWTGSPIAWHWTASANDNTKVDELFHAGLTGRGDFFDTTNAQEFADALREMLSAMGGTDGRSSFAGAGNKSSAVSENDLAYISGYSPDDWTGDLTAHSVCSEASIGQALYDRGFCISRRYYGMPLAGNVWSASERLTAQLGSPGGANSRRVITWSGGRGATFESVSGGGNNPVPNDVADYVKGIQDKEAANGGSFRDRGSLLGDSVNPMPYVLGNYRHNDYGYGGYECDNAGLFVPQPGGVASTRTEACTPAETSFLAAARVRAYRDRMRDFALNGRQELVFMAANAGMLHAFAGGNVNTQTGLLPGSELFAYVPGALLDQLVRLTEPGYAHQYYVDGTPWVSDIWLDGGWKSVLVGSTGRGKTSDQYAGQRGAVFALVVEDVGTSTIGPNDVLWEFTHPDLGAPVDIDPVIVAVPGSSGHRFAAVFGNGYNSETGRAGLFIVPLERGQGNNPGYSGFDFIPVQGGGDRNGLGSPYLLDLDGNGLMDLAYAGDAQGNLWRFDLRDNSVEKLLEARDSDDNPQSISAPPIIMCVGSMRDCDQGYQLVVGTGKYFEDGDVTNTQTQSIYGVRLDTNGRAVNSGGFPVRRSEMQVRVYDENSPDEDNFQEHEGDWSAMEAWKLDKSDSRNPNVDYTSQAGYVIDLTGTTDHPMGVALARAQGTVVVPQTREFFMPVTLPSGEACSSNVAGGVVEFNYEQGTWIKVSQFRRIENESNIWRDNALSGGEEGRDSKYVVSLIRESAGASGSQGASMIAYNRVDGARYGSGRHERLSNIAGRTVPSGRAGRLSWRQMR